MVYEELLSVRINLNINSGDGREFKLDLESLVKEGDDWGQLSDDSDSSSSGDEQEEEHKKKEHESHANSFILNAGSQTNRDDNTDRVLKIETKLNNIKHNKDNENENVFASIIKEFQCWTFCRNK
jgi:hypothetical protein